MARLSRVQLGILCMVAGMFCISMNDMLIKAMSGSYPLHQIVFARTVVGLALTLVLLRLEGGFALLRTDRAGLHLLRAGLVVFANSAFYAAFVAMPLATATALYFIAPLLVTLMAIPVLGERVGPRRLLAVLAGFGGVLLMLSPHLSGGPESAGWLALLPLLAAAGYAGSAVLTRKLGHGSRASALAVYIHSAFLVVSLLFYVVAGDGGLMPEGTNSSLEFLLRPWVWPLPGDLWPMLGLGVLSGVVGYAMAQAYRMASASVVAPFEYLLMIFALFWGWTVFGEWPLPQVLAGAAVIVAAGIYVFWRGERAG